MPLELLVREVPDDELVSWLEADEVASVELFEVMALTPCVEEALSWEVALPPEPLPADADEVELPEDPWT